MFVSMAPFTVADPLPTNLHFSRGTCLRGDTEHQRHNG
jgi:hypothetical protein